MLHPQPEKVSDELFTEDELFDLRDALQTKYEMLRRASVDGLSISRAARSFGFSRPTYYKAPVAFECDGLPGLLPAKSGPRSAHKRALLTIPDGREKVAYIDGGTGITRDVMLAILDGSGSALRLETPWRHEHHVSWGPNGDRLAVDAGHEGIVILELGLDIDGNIQIVGETPVTEVPGSPLEGSSASYSAWAYQHNWIVVSAMTAEDPNPDLWIVDLDDPTNPLRLTQSKEWEGSPSFTPDDSASVFGMAGWYVMQIDSDGNNLLQLQRKGTRPHRRGY